jgi:hypothetical protein
MPNTPKRPDVEGVAARASFVISGWAKMGGLARSTLTCRVCNDIPELIAHIEALEARQVKLEAVVEMAPKCHACEGWTPGKCPLCVGYRQALAALGDGDG